LSDEVGGVDLDPGRSILEVSAAAQTFLLAAPRDTGIGKKLKVSLFVFSVRYSHLGYHYPQTHGGWQKNPCLTAIFPLKN
jgi:hypothetical protein